jgi:hypothetical protein
MTPSTSNPNFDKEKPEGSRETVDEALSAEKGKQQGVTNKPAEEEQRQQEKLPPRGAAKPEQTA